jgi:hypothetical protein
LIARAKTKIWRKEVFTFLHDETGTRRLFELKEHFSGRICDFVRQYLHISDSEKIAKISFSLSGIVDTPRGVVVRSFLLDTLSGQRNLFSGIHLVEHFPALLSLSHSQPYVLNDSIAAALGCYSLVSRESAGRNFPLLSVTLGTGPAVSVIDTNAGNLDVWSCEDWGVAVPCSEGIVSLYNALNSSAAKSMDANVFFFLLTGLFRFCGRTKLSRWLLIAKRGLHAAASRYKSHTVCMLYLQESNKCNKKILK